MDGVLLQGLKSPLPEKRQGVCLGLSEVIGASTRKQIDDFLPVLIPAVQDALCDVSPEVREAAATAFNKLQHIVGIKAVDEILPSLLAELSSPDARRSHQATHGLRGILALRSREVRSRQLLLLFVGGGVLSW